VVVDDRIEARVVRRGKGSTKRDRKPWASKEGPRGLSLSRASGDRVQIKNLFEGETIFLILSGPSLCDYDLGRLDHCGAFSFGVNNSWSIYRPTFWTCADGPDKFLSGGWKDPRIMKLVPNRKQKDKLRTKEGGKFVDLPITTSDCPNVLYYPRNLEFDPTTFLTEASVNWGQTSKSKDLLGVNGCRSVMLAAVRLSYYLGFRRIYLLGCDFKMETNTRYNYAFPQARWPSAVQGNNGTYKGLNKRFKALLPHFEQHGLKVFNCYKDSGLTAFPYRPFEKAVDEFENSIPEMEDTLGWYDKEKSIKTVRRNAKRNS
jgi:hypothetical protein